MMFMNCLLCFLGTMVRSAPICNVNPATGDWHLWNPEPKIKILPWKMKDVVAIWDVTLSDGVHKIEFEHGTTSGKRVVYVDGKEEIRKEWMFQLVGKETFCVGPSKTKATIHILSGKGYVFKYTLDIEGKSFKKYIENRSKMTNTWILHLDGENFRIVLEKNTMDVWCNGKIIETTGAFVEDGTETHFSVGSHNCYIKAVSSGKSREGIIHTLIVDNQEVPESEVLNRRGDIRTC